MGSDAVFPGDEGMAVRSPLGAIGLRSAASKADREPAGMTASGQSAGPCDQGKLNRFTHRRALLALQRTEPALRGVELHLIASGDLFIASGRGVSAGLMARFTGLPWTPAEACLEPAEIATWLEALPNLRLAGLSRATRTAIDRIAA